MWNLKEVLFSVKTTSIQSKPLFSCFCAHTPVPREWASVVLAWEVANTEFFLATMGEWMHGGMKGWGVIEAQLSKTQNRPSTLVPTNDQRPWIPPAPLGQQLLPSPASPWALKGTWQQLSWLCSCLAEQQLGDGGQTVLLCQQGG